MPGMQPPQKISSLFLPNLPSASCCARRLNAVSNMSLQSAASKPCASAFSCLFAQSLHMLSATTMPRTSQRSSPETTDVYSQQGRSSVLAMVWTLQLHHVSMFLDSARLQKKLHSAIIHDIHGHGIGAVHSSYSSKFVLS